MIRKENIDVLSRFNFTDYLNQSILWFKLNIINLKVWILICSILNNVTPWIWLDTRNKILLVK